MDLNLPGSGQTVSQTFSVFDYDTGKYRYFAAPIAALPLTGHYRAPRNRTPEGLAVPVPPHAQPVGDGAVPKGVIATLGGVGEPATTTGTKVLPIVVVGAALLFLWSRR